MDLRTKKTLNSINNAFIELRAKKPLSKITIKELTANAMISKPTFYLHYRDIYDLSDSLENEMIDSILKLIPPDIKPFDDSEQWYICLFQAFLSQGQLLNILFSDDRKHIFVAKLNSAIKKHMLSIYPEYSDNTNFSVLTDFFVYGTFNAFIQNSQVPQEQLIDIIIQFTRQIIPLRLNQKE